MAQLILSTDTAQLLQLKSDSGLKHIDGVRSDIYILIPITKHPTKYRYNLLPNQYNTPPNPTLTPKCIPTPHPTAYRYFGENTVQTNRCVLSTVQAAITPSTLAATNTVRQATYCSHTPPPSPPAFRFLTNNVVTAKVQYIAPAQLLTNVSNPTGTGLKSEMPL